MGEVMRKDDRRQRSPEMYPDRRHRRDEGRQIPTRSRSHDRSGGGDRRGDGYDPEQLLKKAVVSSKVSAVDKPSSRRRGELSSKLILKATAEADKSVKESSRRQTRE